MRDVTAPRRVLAWLVLTATLAVLASATHAWWRDRSEAPPETVVVHSVDGGTAAIAAPPLDTEKLRAYAVAATLRWMQREAFTISYPDWGEGVAVTVDTAVSEMTLDFWGERNQIQPWADDTMQRWASCLFTAGGIGLSDCLPSPSADATLLGVKTLPLHGAVVGVQVHLVDGRAESWHELWFGGDQAGDAVLMEVTSFATWPDDTAADAMDWATYSVGFRA